MKADICLLVEGSYPYVEGGVSAWVHALIRNLSEFSFSLVHLGSTPDPGRIQRYSLPPNVVSFQELFIHDARGIKQRTGSRHSSEAWECLREFHEARAHGLDFDDARLLTLLGNNNPGGIPAHDLIYSRKSWDLMAQRHGLNAPSSSLIDFFWTFRFTHLPIFKLLEVSIPPAGLYHSISAGFNAFLGVMAKLRTGAPLILTEHGIYTREREIEIGQAEWIPDHQVSWRLSREQGLFHEWWANMFKYMARLSYDFSDRIISITTGNQRYQLQNGAQPQKMMVIPNAIAVDSFSGLRELSRRNSHRFVVGFVGRVVPIKDVTAFIRAIKMASSIIPNLLAYVVGPTDEDPEYFAECGQLVSLLELSSIVRFFGRADVREYYQTIDVLVLTSLSEAMPLVILEANCAGIPAVATDVGACRELLTGMTPEDQALGPSGLLVPPASPVETADALVRLWRDEELRLRMGRAGRERVKRFYREENLYAAYRALYGQFVQPSLTAARA